MRPLYFDYCKSIKGVGRFHTIVVIFQSYLLRLKTSTMALDGVSAAASIVALIDTSLKVVSLCAEYYSHVKTAKKDIDRFSLELQAFIKVLHNLDKLARNPVGATSLCASISLNDDIKRCLLDLERLQKKLDQGKRQKPMSRHGIRAFKWPFESKELEKDIGVLERYKSIFNAALNIDQT